MRGGDGSEEAHGVTMATRLRNQKMNRTAIYYSMSFRDWTIGGADNDRTAATAAAAQKDGEGKARGKGRQYNRSEEISCRGADNGLPCLLHCTLVATCWLNGWLVQRQRQDPIYAINCAVRSWLVEVEFKVVSLDSTE